MKKTITVTIDPITYEQMEVIRKETRQSRSEYIREALLTAERLYNRKQELDNWRIK